MFGTLCEALGGGEVRQTWGKDSGAADSMVVEGTGEVGAEMVTDFATIFRLPSQPEIQHMFS